MKSKNKDKKMNASTINQEEVDRFSAIAKEWWDPNGKFKPLHKFNPSRLAYIREQILIHFNLNGSKREPFKKLSILDIGCGGGLLCEPMARLGAKVTGIDASQKNISIATAHAKQSDLKIDYRATTSEDLAKKKKQYDIVLNMEVIEHVDNVPLYLKSCADLVKPNGIMFISTLNRTAKSFALAIVGAEYILGWLPKGTHTYQKFLTPNEITSMLKRNDLKLKDKCGITYSPLKDKWKQSRDMSVNYMLLFEKQALLEK
jgi:2-polyprenyl-6-hydroxyphenyl methylase/3-demethylubiquinone-9 3-methyltransferase